MSTIMDGDEAAGTSYDERRRRQEDSESESGSSYAGSDMSPVKDQFSRDSTQGVRTDESRNDIGGEATLRQHIMGADHGTTAGSSRSPESLAVREHDTLKKIPTHRGYLPNQDAQDQDGISSLSEAAAGRQGGASNTEANVRENVAVEEQPQQGTVDLHYRDSFRYSPDRSGTQSSSQDDGVPQSQTQSQLSSTAQSLYGNFDSEGISGESSASTSAHALTSGIPAHEDVSRGSHSSTAVPAPIGASPQLPTRNSRDIVLPRWQPDAEVTYCPICRTQFSFFVRKHHCRKCGRVVCNSCSPHRITIPYQFIVQPPPLVPVSTEPQAGQIIASRESELVLADRHGGMKVRLCNPCVPDPNTLPPQQPVGYWRGVTQPTYYVNNGTRGYVFGEQGMSNIERSSHSLTRDTQARARGMSAASGLTPTSREQQTIGAVHGGRAGTAVLNSPYPNTQATRYSNQAASHTTRPVSYVGPAQPNPIRGHTRGNQSLSFNPTGLALNSNPQPHYRSLLDVNDQRPQPPNLDTRPLPAIPRIPEEDECPVCHKELPSRALPNFEDARAAHITKCIDDQIAMHSGQARPEAYTSQSQPDLTPSTSMTDNPPSQPPPPSASSPAQIVPSRPSASSRPTQPTIPAPIANTPEARMAAREAAHAAVVLGASQSSSPSGDMGRRTGMFLYKASEKDCVDDAECTICLEEFEVGVGMARLECLCRFHASCIREWFVDHPGRCPVHQHDGYGF